MVTHPTVRPEPLQTRTHSVSLLSVCSALSFFCQRRPRHHHRLRRLPRALLLPLLTDLRINDRETPIPLTFNQNTMYALLLRTFLPRSFLHSLPPYLPHCRPFLRMYLRSDAGGVVPLKFRGTTNDTLYTRYSSLGTVQTNWDLKLKSLRRQNSVSAYKNVKVPSMDVPQCKLNCNLTGVAPGGVVGGFVAFHARVFCPLSPVFTPFPAAVNVVPPAARPQHVPHVHDPVLTHDNAAANQNDAMVDEPGDDKRPLVALLPTSFDSITRKTKCSLVQVPFELHPIRPMA
ncbi:Phosphoesterase-domain-containing protein [Mycena venus]|uniref:Phosphoesterase-domain-containing protein n=1 Tax=Mycena venus TaxID=2733690 RepID=A0A8H6X3W3_9AGAR|nr:Phosphoesterase-domain-containing protein [Mycena venus]